ncbi:NAD(P)/FAD-dependent oxidoreductase [Aquihabitans sp. McL0605]|uniref:NAD(P)/FAD-dependent oxidoreductase n=1 Tax=Aquihabitans sp. McL0605 TaxID=3415671 RepID=UPI003CF095B1
MKRSVVVVGGGFAGVACAKRLAKHGVEVKLVDRNNYHQFQPLLYQVATAQLGVPDIARPLRDIFVHYPNVRVTTGHVASIDLEARSVTTSDGVTLSGDVLVLAAGARPNFFATPGAEELAFPLYSVNDAERLRSRLLGIIDSVDRDAKYLEQGALNFVVVGAGATGVETSGAVAEMIHEVIPHFYPEFPVDRARVIVVDHGSHVLNGFTEKSQRFATDALERDGVEFRFGTGVAEVQPSKVVLSDGSEIPTHLVIWAGGEQASTVIGASGLPQGRGGRIDVEPDLSAPGHPDVYVLGDAANITDQHGNPLPQLGSVAQQAGTWAGANIMANLAGRATTPFEYHDKGIMAMVGRNAAVAELGAKRHEIDGPMAFAAWLGVHASLLSGTRDKIGALLAWSNDYVSKKRPAALVDHPDAYRIDWEADD